MEQNFIDLNGAYSNIRNNDGVQHEAQTESINPPAVAGVDCTHLEAWYGDRKRNLLPLGQGRCI